MIDFATFCHEGDKQKLFNNFNNYYASHQYKFDNVFVVHQRTEPLTGWDSMINLVKIEESEYPGILMRNGISPINEQADHYTHGWTGNHYWMHHIVNHLVSMEHSKADYIVLCDSDCFMKTNNNWVNQAINILQNDKSALVVSPSDGGTETKTQIMSQQLFMCERQRLLDIDLDLPFEGFNICFQEYYFLLEGRIGKYMEKNGLYRRFLGHDCRYWHQNT